MRTGRVGKNWGLPPFTFSAEAVPADSIDYALLFRNRLDTALLAAAAPPFAVLDASDGAVQAFGVARERLVGRPLLGLFGDAPAPAATELGASVRCLAATRGAQRAVVRLPNRSAPASVALSLAGSGGDSPVLVRIEHAAGPGTVAEDALHASEERFRAFVTASSDAVYRMSADWGIMAHLDGKDFIADTEGPNHAWLQKYIHPDDQDRVMEAIRQAIAAKTTFELEHRVIRADGSLGWTFSRAIPILDPEGDIIEWLGTATDVTERKQAQGNLVQLRAESDRERRLYRAILSTTPDLVYVFNPQHQFTYVNDALLRMWGRTFEDSVGKTCLQLGYEPWHAEMHDREIDTVVATRKPIRGEVPFTGTNGRRIYDYIFAPVFGANGEVEAVSGTTRDITEMVQARETVAERRAELERLVGERTAKLQQTIAQLEEFSYSVSHDLRSPARAMQAYSEALLQDHGDRLDAEARALLERINRSARRMDRLIQDLLTYTRVSRREVPLERVSLGKLIPEIIQQYPELQAERARVELPAEPIPDVVAHEPSLTQVISNLLTNAVKFVQPGTRPQVQIGFECVGGTLRLWCRDNGIGVPLKHQERLFGMFERVHRDRDYEGNGIGLAIVRKAVERMNGRVGVVSDGVSGSQFWIELPAA